VTLSVRSRALSGVAHNPGFGFDQRPGQEQVMISGNFAYVNGQRYEIVREQKVPGGPFVRYFIDRVGTRREIVET